MVPIHTLILQAIFSATKEDSILSVQQKHVQQQHVRSPPQRKIIPKNQKRPSKTRTVKKRRGEYENRDTHI